MGRYLGKCKGVMGEVAVVGVRTRARAALAMAASGGGGGGGASSLPEKKIRKVSGAGTTRYNVHELRSSARRRAVMTAAAAEEEEKEKENSAPSRIGEVAEAAVNCSGSDVSSDLLASCCSSNVATSSCEVGKDRLKIVADPEVESSQALSRQFDCRSEEARRDQSKLGAAESDNLDSSPRFSDAKSTVPIKTPSDAEIEDFFVAAEKDLQKHFTDKYNFDIVKDVPLEGRYEWVQIKQ